MDKSLVLSVTVGTGCYRHIQVSEMETLSSLSDYILVSFDFFDDHMHAFFMNNRIWDPNFMYIGPEEDILGRTMDLNGAAGYSSKVILKNFRLGVGDKFLYVFDFGDEWRFRIKVLRIINEYTEVPNILRYKGEVSQYGEDDDWDDDED